MNQCFDGVTQRCPKIHNVTSACGWKSSLEILLQVALVSKFEDDIIGSVLNIAPIKMDYVWIIRPRRRSEMSERLDLVVVVFVGVGCMIRFQNEGVFVLSSYPL
jgi:hypothetical protein